MQQKFKRLALIGCGLMGGSFALAVRDAGLVQEVCGFSRPGRTAQNFKDSGVIDHVASSAADAVRGADLVLLAVPVAAMPAILAEVASALDTSVLLMDVGSTKRSIARAATALGERAADFVPAHPIAGKERAGAADPIAHLYRDRKIILTPLASSRPERIDQAAAVWAAIGASCVIMTPEDHDRGLAAVSHLPHLLAFAYMNGLLAQPDANRLLSLGGPGFRDFSRIAGCDPLIWRDILRDNRDQVLDQLAAFRLALEEFEQEIRGGELGGEAAGESMHDSEKLLSLLQRASDARAAWKTT